MNHRYYLSPVALRPFSRWPPYCILASSLSGARPRRPCPHQSSVLQRSHRPRSLRRSAVVGGYCGHRKASDCQCCSCSWPAICAVVEAGGVRRRRRRLPLPQRAPDVLRHRGSSLYPHSSASCKTSCLAVEPLRRCAPAEWLDSSLATPPLRSTSFLSASLHLFGDLRHTAHQFRLASSYFLGVSRKPQPPHQLSPLNRPRLPPLSARRTEPQDEARSWHHGCGHHAPKNKPLRLKFKPLFDLFRPLGQLQPRSLCF